MNNQERTSPPNAVDPALLDMALHAQKFPPSEPFFERLRKTVHLHPHERFVVVQERTPCLAYGLLREEQLGEAGISGAENDSKQFAQRLLAALDDSLSARNLEHLVEVFTAARDERRAEINEARSRMAALDQPRTGD